MVMKGGQGLGFLALCMGLNAAAHSPPHSGCRSALTWPFTADSIWNTAVGSSAQFGPTSLYAPGSGPNASFYNLGIDEMVFLVATAQDPSVAWYDQGHWGQPKTPAAYCTVTGPFVQDLHVPYNFTSTEFGGNNAVALLQPDQETVYILQPVYRCAPGSPYLALRPRAGQESANIVTGTGNLGGHGGSGLSGLGGAIRRGELLPSAPPIPHALQLEFFAHLFYFLPPVANASQCFTWPATQCDGYCFSRTDPGRYGGTNPLLTPGALLAIPAANVGAVNATLETVPAQKLLVALAHYGGYVVDDSECPSLLCETPFPPLRAHFPALFFSFPPAAYWNATGITAEVGVREEFLAAYGFTFNTTANAQGLGAAWYRDYLALMRALMVVTSNSPATQGGGGAPLGGGGGRAAGGRGGAPCPPPPPLLLNRKQDFFYF